MTFYLIGIDYKTTPLKIREQAYRMRQEINQFWQSQLEHVGVLFTCNRVEIYFITEDMYSVINTIGLFRKIFPVIFDDAYVKGGIGEVAHHALRLASGLESQILGEGQILTQLSSWIENDIHSEILRKFWQRVIEGARHIRASVVLPKHIHMQNIADLVLEDFISITQKITNKKIVIIGTGGVAQLFTQRKPERIYLYFVSNKKHSRARQLAKISRGSAVLIDDLSSVITNADAVISATSSPHYVLKEERFSSILKQRNKRLYIYDLAIPRDIDPRIGEIECVSLKSLDDLTMLFDKHNHQFRVFRFAIESLINTVVQPVIKEVKTYADQSWHAPKLFSVAAS